MTNHHTRAVPEIDDGQREELERWLRRSRTGQALSARPDRSGVRRGRERRELAARLDTTRATVGKWRRRFIEKGVTAFWTIRGRVPRARSATRTSNGL